MCNDRLKASSFTTCALIGAGMAAALFPGAALAEGKGVTKSEFVAAIVGKTVSTTTSKGKSMSAVYKADGTGETAVEGIKKQPMKWTYKGTTLCTTIKAWSLTECNYVEIVSPNKANFVDAKTGKLNNVYSIK
jgi:hypothetical protein